MDSPTAHLPTTTSTPLHPLSPERVNVPKHSLSVFGSPQSSPSRNKDLSDVQGMVARFNALDIKDHAELRKKEQAALRRAQMGREEAEAEAKRWREECRGLKREGEEGRERERRVVRRLDVVMVSIDSCGL